MIERILAILKNKNMSPSQFADEIGIQRSGMSHLISGRNKPSLEFILKILKRFPDIDPTWLLLGGENEPHLQQKLEFDLPRQNTHEPEEKEIIQPLSTKKKAFTEIKEPDDQSIDRIVILYHNKKFRNYFPEEED